MIIECVQIIRLGNIHISVMKIKEEMNYRMKRKQNFKTDSIEHNRVVHSLNAFSKSSHFLVITEITSLKI